MEGSRDVCSRRQCGMQRQWWGLMITSYLAGVTAAPSYQLHLIGVPPPPLHQPYTIHLASDGVTYPSWLEVHPETHIKPLSDFSRVPNCPFLQLIVSYVLPSYACQILDNLLSLVTKNSIIHSSYTPALKHIFDPGLLPFPDWQPCMTHLNIVDLTPDNTSMTPQLQLILASEKT